MIKLNDVTKSYVSKTKQRVDALKGVSFELPDKGMTFILGKSGSGKSTLLNLLGGLDSPSGGEIVVDGVSMKDFKPTDYDGYRNGYVGFIFQEYNLLDDFNVKDNVALALQLSEETDVDEKVKDALKQVELGDDYLLRRVGELSGGEKQRVAIARSIVKDSKMILADEPTGNLDSATGESIWNILKKLSETKLVVVVSHDRESAEKYGDRIIEIADGKVIADSGLKDGGNETPTENATASIAPFGNTSRKRLPALACLKMGLNNLAQRKVKTVSVILISIFTILALLITEMFIAFSPERTIAKYVHRYDVPYFAVQQRLRDDEGELSYLHIIRKDTLDYVGEHADYIVDGVVENRQQMLDFGFTFVGESLELTPDSFYVTTDSLAISFEIGRNYYLDDTGKKIALIEETPTELLIGKWVHVNGAIANEDDIAILAGIVDSSVINENARLYVPHVFYREDYKHKNYWGSTLPLNFNRINAVLQYGEQSYANRMDLTTRLPRGREFGVLTADGLKTYDEFQQIALKDDEIVLTYELYAALFDAKSKWYYVSSDVSGVNPDAEMPAELGQKLPLKFFNSVTQDLVVDFGEYKLAGIVFQTFFSTEERDKNYVAVVNGESLLNMNYYLDIGKTILIKSDTVANLGNFMTVLNKKYDTKVVNAGTVHFVDSANRKDASEIVFSMIYTMRLLLIVMYVICAIMVLVLVLLVINLISFNIANRKREIGILSALGASNSDVTKIFIFETFIIAAISFLVTLILSFVVAAVINAVESAEYTTLISFFRVDTLTIAVLAVASFGLLLLAALIPTRKIAKLKPIDAIRNV